MRTTENPMREARTTGTVVGHRHKKRRGMDNKVDILVHPVVRFEAENGETVEFESGMGSNIPPKVGEAVEVFYDPSNPESGARIPVGSALRIKPWHFIVAAAMFVVPAILFFAFFLLMVVVSLV
jgi:hypothetical protein